VTALSLEKKYLSDCAMDGLWCNGWSVWKSSKENVKFTAWRNWGEIFIYLL